MNNKKIVFTAPWNVEVWEEEIDRNDIPAKHVLIKKHYSLISAGTELACLSGSESWFVMPEVPGYSSVGEVVAVGEGIEGFTEGDLVFYYGTHSKYELSRMEEIFMLAPHNIDEKLIPFTRLATIAMTSLRVSGIELGDHVAVTGQGLVGNMAAQLAKLQGATVTSIDLSDKRLQTALDCGIDYAVNPKRHNTLDKIRDITNAAGVSTLIEATGVPKVVVDSLPLLARGGELILLGSPRGEFQYNVTDLLNYCHLADLGFITFKGAHEWRFPLLKDDFVKHSIERNTKIVFGLIERGLLKIMPLISHIIKPDEASEAYINLKEKKDDNLGVLIDWND